MRRPLRTAALCTAALVACSDSPFEPQGTGERVPIGQVITDEVGSDTEARYSFAGGDDALYAIFLEALDGRVVLSVIDSTHPFQASTISSGPGSPSLYQNATQTLFSRDNSVFNIRVFAVPGGTSARFRFIVYAINRRPERLSARFALGDTVSGEAIDPIVDVDEFVIHGEAGQEIVAVGETQGAPGSGSVALTVVDPSGPSLLGSVFADAGTPTLTTGRIRLPTTRDYRFSFGSVTSNTYPRYSGPYRFWSYSINRAPEHRGASAPFDTEVSNERIDKAGDVDEFTFVAGANSEFNVFFQSPGVGQLEIEPPLTGAFTVGAHPGDTSLFAHATGRFHIDQAGTYRVRVSGAQPSRLADTGAYRWYLYAIDPRPEHVPQSITPGDTILGEDLGQLGDVDEFTFNGVAGATYNVFLQALNGSDASLLRLEVRDGQTTMVAAVESRGTDTSLMHQFTDRFVTSGTGTLRIRVTDVWSASGVAGGPYRLLLHRINPVPETAPATLAFGDSLSTEAMELPGDVDEFFVTVPDTSGAHLVFQHDGQIAAGGWGLVQLLKADTRQQVLEMQIFGSGPVSSGRLRLEPGNYIVRTDIPRYALRAIYGPYRLWFYRIGLAPEVAADTFAIGDTVSGEELEPWGDADRFLFFGVRGQHINFMAQGLAAPSGGGFQFFLTPPPGAPGHGLFVNTPTASNALEDRQTTRVDLPATGWYTVEVSGGGGGPSERGPYRFTVQSIDPGPEHVSATLAPGDAVTNEPMDEPGDWDEFTVPGVPGEMMSVLFEGTDGFTGPWVYLYVVDPATGDTLAWQPSQFHRIAGPFRIPSGGQAKIAVYQPTGFFRICYTANCGGLFNFVGPYRFRLLAVNSAPETASAAFAVGDTIRGESLSAIGDIDEFTATGTPGEQLTLFDRLSVTSSLDSALVLQIIDPATGTSLVGGNIAILGSSDFYQIGSFTVPPNGTFIVRARVYGKFGYGVGQTAPYEFVVKRP
jgi:hypothetical protein